jgi:tetratricopeptide (TPR) repeat protein
MNILRSIATKNLHANILEKLTSVKTAMFKTIAVIIFFSSVLLAQTPDVLMQNANKFYQDGNFDSAIQTYQKILGQGFESGTMYFNLGNAYFRSGKLGYAIYNYEKGLKLEPNDEDLAYNLKIANLRTFDKITQLPKLFIVSWWEGLVTSLSISGWSMVVVVVFWVLLGSIAVYYFSRRTKFLRIAFLSSSVSLALLLIVILILFSRVNREAATNYGILLEQTYSAKASPDSKGNDAFVVHEGIKFAIDDQLNDWVKIRLTDGKVGWVQKNAIGQI